MKVAKKPAYKYCIVPMCTNTIRTTPDKVFFPVPHGAKVRNQWCMIMRRRDKVSAISCLHVCEDHFNVMEDTTNYVQYNIMKQHGEKVSLRLKKGVVPHIFMCQKPSMLPPVESGIAIKRQKIAMVTADLSEYAVKSSNVLEIGEPPQTSHYEICPSTSYTKMALADQIELKFCRVCLAVDVKMYEMQEFRLSEMFQNVTGIPACDETERELHRVCWECAARLTAASTFRDKALLTDTLLKDLVHTNKSDIEQLRNYYSYLKSPLTVQTVLISADLECDNTPIKLHSDETVQKKAYKTKAKQKCNEEEVGNVFDEVEPLVEFPVKTEIESDPIAENNINIQIKDENSVTFSETSNLDDSINFEEQINEVSIDIEMINAPIKYGIDLLEDNAKKQTTIDAIDNVSDEREDTEMTIELNNDSEIVLEEENLGENPVLDGIDNVSDASSSEEDGQSLAELASVKKTKKQTSRKVGASNKRPNRLNDGEKQKIIALKEKGHSLREIAKITGKAISRISGSKPRKRGSTWDEDSLRRAMEAVQNNQLSQNAAALKFNIPRRTLRNHLASGKSTKNTGKTAVLTKQLEEDLSQRMKRFAKLGIPLTPKFIRKQAFLFCERFKIKHSFNMSTRMAGHKWLKMFLARNPSISKRKPQLMNPARAKKLSKFIVKHHFEEVKKLYEELDIIAHPERLYNMDEKGCPLTVHKQNVVLAEKGNTRVHLVAPEHAENVTIAMCVNAVGIAIPPMIIFKGSRYRSELASNLPPGTKVSMAPQGSMTSSLFVEFIQHLAQHKAPGMCLLVFDGAKCHLSYEALEEADKNNIVLYCFPSNTTHELQPLDKSVNQSFEHHWDEEVLNYLCDSQERTLNKGAFNKIFSRTWPKCMTQTNITNGFKATGLYPLDLDIIPEDAYDPSIVTENPLPESLQDQINQPLITVLVSPTVSEFNKVSEWSSQSLIDERRSAVSDFSSIFPSTSKGKTSRKFSAATKKRKPVLVSYSSSTDASDTD